MARSALFDLAINRALSYSLKLKLDNQSPNLAAQLEPWYQQTRFAYRIPLDAVCKVLKTYPTERSAKYFWQGGQLGAWVVGKNPAP